MCQNSEQKVLPRYKIRHMLTKKYLIKINEIKECG